ncbi:MAG: acyl-CoA dehydrogenase family protein [Burkholderiaceae bacterium]
MDFHLNDEQMALADAIERFCQAEYPAHTRGEPVSRDEAARRWRALAQTGVAGLPFAEPLGGSALGMAEMMLVAQALGRSLAGSGWLASVALAGMTIDALGSDAQRERWLAPLIEGEARYGFAFGEPGVGGDLACRHTTAHRHHEGGWQIDGHKHLVLDGADADMFVVVARLDGSQGDAFSLAGRVGAAHSERFSLAGRVDRADEAALAVLAVPARAPGLNVKRFRTLDGRDAAHLGLVGVRVDDDALIGGAGQASEAVQDALDRASALLVAEAAGALDALIAQTAEHLRTRQQFGRPLADFQALQHRLADMVIALEQARSMAYLAAVAFDDIVIGRAERQRHVSAAKALVGPAGRRVAMQAIQMHGAMGMTDECRVGHYAKRLMVIDRLFGDENHHLRRLARLTADR